LYQPIKGTGAELVAAHFSHRKQRTSAALCGYPAVGMSIAQRRLRHCNRQKESAPVSYLVPSEFVTKMIDAGESKIFMSTRDTIVRAYMAGAILALAAWFAITITVNTGQPLVGALMFPVGFSMLILHDAICYRGASTRKG
jgi:Formate/nitrite transporter